MDWIVYSFVGATCYLAVGVMYLCLRVRPKGLRFDEVLDPVIWWLPDLLRGRPTGIRWRKDPEEIVMGLVLAFCLFAPIASLLISYHRGI